MNWKMIIRAAFDLTGEEWDQVVKLRELGEADRGLLMERLGPQKPAAKKSSASRNKRCVAELLDGSTCKMVLSHSIHDKDNQELNAHEFLPLKSSKKAGKKSARASGMAAQLNKQLGNRRQEQEPEDGEGFDVSRLCFKCAKLADNNVHHLENDPDYHLFIESLSEEARAALGE